MKKMTRTLFVLSDTVTLFLGLIALAMLLYFPLFAEVGESLTHKDLTVISALSLSALAGAGLLLCRKALGLVLILLPAVFWLLDHKTSFAISYTVAVLLFMGTPYLLAMKEARNNI